MTGVILITRPEPAASEFAELLKKQGRNVMVEPMLKQKDKLFILPDMDEVQGLIFTSAVAVSRWCGMGGEKNIPVFAVGRQSATAARECGFEEISNAGGDVYDLVEMIARECSPEKGSLIHVCGVHQSGDVKGDLEELGFEVKECVAYEMEAIEALSNECKSALSESSISAVTFFSKRTAENFVRLICQDALEGALSNIKALCISDGVLNCLEDLPWLETYSAVTPDRDGMLALVREKS